MDINELKDIYVEGDVVSEVTTTIIDGVEIDNYVETKVYAHEELVDTVTEKRELPEKVMPPHVVDAPAPHAKLVLMDHKEEFWLLDKKVDRDITVWVVAEEEGKTKLVDAVTGETVGHGTPPPSSNATAISGYCAGYNDPWASYRANAASYFNRWGYSAWNVYGPSKASVGSKIRNKSYKMHYALAHGDWNRFQLTSRQWVYASDIRSYMAGGAGGSGSGEPLHRPTPDVPAPGGRPPFQFSFLGQCGAFTSMSSSTIHSAFRRGSTTKTCAIGYYNAHLSAGWRDSLKWQQKLFLTVNSGYSFYTAFIRANAAFPACRDMTRFVGDTTVGKSPIDYGDEYDDDSGDGGDGGDSGDTGGQGGSSGPAKRGSGGSGTGGSGSGGSGSGPQGR